MIAELDNIATDTTPIAKSIDELLASVSASRLNMFHSCRLKFYFHYVLGLKRAKTGAQHIGSTVHYVLKLWNIARWRKQIIPDGWLKSQYETYWTEQPDGKITWKQNEEGKSKAIAWNLLETYFKQSPIPPNESAEGVEVSIEAELGSTKLVGIIDLVRSNGRIVEYKTTGQTPNPEKAEHLHELQCLCYSIMYRACTGHKETGIELHHLVKLKTPKLVVTQIPPMSFNQEKRLYQTIDSYLDGVERKEWIPSPNPMTCACCEFFNECRKWCG